MAGQHNYTKPLKITLAQPLLKGLPGVGLADLPQSCSCSAEWHHHGDVDCLMVYKVVTIQIYYPTLIMQQFHMVDIFLFTWYKTCKNKMLQALY